MSKFAPSFDSEAKTLLFGPQVRGKGPISGAQGHLLPPFNMKGVPSSEAYDSMMLKKTEAAYP